MKEIYILNPEEVPELKEIKKFAPHLVGRGFDDSSGRILKERLTANKSEDGRVLFPLTKDQVKKIPAQLKRFFKNPITSEQCAELMSSESWHSNNRFEKLQKEFMEFVTGKRYGIDTIEKEDMDPDKIQIFWEQRGIPQEDIDKLKNPHLGNKKVK